MVRFKIKLNIKYIPYYLKKDIRYYKNINIIIYNTDSDDFSGEVINNSHYWIKEDRFDNKIIGIYLICG